MKVMLIQLPHFYRATFRPPTLYPLGIGYLAAVLKDHHHLIPMDLWIHNATVDQAIAFIKQQEIPDVFGISVYSTQYPYFKELVFQLKKNFPNIKIVAGGPGATFSSKIFLEKLPIDYCVIGEGEFTFLELLQQFNSPETVNGIAYRKDNQVFYTPPREQIKNLDLLPLPDRQFFDIERYMENSKKDGGVFHRLRSINLIAGRGCPYQCIYCSKTFSGCRLRSIQSIAEEIDYLKRTYHAQAIEFDDELVVINKKRTLELCSFLRKANLKWGCQGRINLVDEEILRSMKASGCFNIGYGVESYSQKILDRMKKQIKVEDIIPVIELTKKIGMNPIIQYMFGFPGEDDETIEATFQFFKKIDHPFVGMPTTPIPGTVLYEEAFKKGLIGDEEEYLIKLTSGYNNFIVNMTGFSDIEYLKKRHQLSTRVNIEYYKKHPIKFLQYLTKIIIYVIKLFITKPRYFINRFMHFYQ